METSVDSTVGAQSLRSRVSSRAQRALVKKTTPKEKSRSPSPFSDSEDSVGTLVKEIVDSESIYKEIHKSLQETKAAFDEQAHKLTDDILGFIIDYIAETTKRAKDTVRIDWSGEHTTTENQLRVLDNFLYVSLDVVKSIALDCGISAPDQGDSASTASKKLYVKLSGGIRRRRTLTHHVVRNYCQAWFYAKEGAADANVFKSLANLSDFCMRNLDEIALVMRDASDDDEEDAYDEKQDE